jgi:hypothetical protein
MTAHAVEPVSSCAESKPEHSCGKILKPSKAEYNGFYEAITMKDLLIYSLINDMKRVLRFPVILVKKIIQPSISIIKNVSEAFAFYLTKNTPLDINSNRNEPT